MLNDRCSRSRCDRHSHGELEAGIEQLRGQLDLGGGVDAEALDAGSGTARAPPRSSKTIVQPSTISSRITIIMSKVV